MKMVKEKHGNVKKSFLNKKKKVDEIKKNDKNSYLDGKNIYKISTYILLSIILLFFLYLLIGSYVNSKYIDGVKNGEERAVKIILSKVSKDGFVSLYYNNKSYMLLEENFLINTINQSLAKRGYFVINIKNGENITLVSQNSLKISQEAVIRKILDMGREKGYVSLYDENGEVIFKVVDEMPIVQNLTE